MKRLVILGSSTDPHVTRVADRLVERRASVMFFDPGRQAIHVSHRIAVPMHPPVFSALDYASQQTVEVDLRESIVWLRRKWRASPIKSSVDQDTYYRVSELEGFFYGSLGFYAVPHFNSLAAVAIVGHKPIQLTLAAKIGFQIPPTLVSNDKAEILAFLDECDDDCIMKPLAGSFIPAAADGSRGGFSLMTRTVKMAEVENARDEEVSWAPCIYQKRIEKDHELRVVATSYGCVAYKIDSQNSRLGKLDWRHAQFERIYSPTRMDARHAGKFSEFVDEAGLEYGVFDAIVAASGELVFLECNPDGQWAWLEQFCGTCDVTALVADAVHDLLQHDRTPSAIKAGGLEHDRVRLDR